MPAIPHTLRLAMLAGLLVPATGAGAQARAPQPPDAPRAPGQTLYFSGRPAGSGAILGVTPRTSSGAADTLGLLLDDVDESLPAGQAGIRRGARLVSIDGINLRLDPGDIGDSAAEQVPESRLRRALAAKRPGEQVSLVVLTDGRRETKQVTLGESPMARTFRAAMAPLAPRRVLGLGFATRGSARDTAGLLITSITTGGAAEKAGLSEGDRVVSIDGVDLRVPAADAGTSEAVEARVARLRRALEAARESEPVRLEVLSEGRVRTIAVTPTRESGWSFTTGGGGMAAFAGDIEAGVRASVDRADVARITAEARAEAARARAQIQRDMAESQRAMERSGREMQRDMERAGREAERELRLSEREVERAPVRERAQAGRAPTIWRFDSRDAARRDQAEIRVLPRVDADVRVTVPAPAPAPAPRPAPMVRGYAIPARPAEPADLPTGMRGRTDGATLSVGGITLAVVDRDFGQQFGRGAENGALVVRVRSDWEPVRAGDVILSLDDRPVRSGDTIDVTIDRSRDIQVDLLRNGRRITVTVPASR